MNVNMFHEDNSSMSSSFTGSTPRKPPKKYGFFKFIFDCLMTLITGGFWLIWVFVREMRGRRR